MSRVRVAVRVKLQAICQQNAVSGGPGKARPAHQFSLSPISSAIAAQLCAVPRAALVDLPDDLLDLLEDLADLVFRNDQRRGKRDGVAGDTEHQPVFVE